MGRSSMAGDNLSALVTARYVKKIDPCARITWAIGKKCSSMAPLLISHPDLDEIFVTDGVEGLESERDFAKFNSCDYRLNLNPQHPPGSIYPRSGNIFYESFLMAGFSPEQWDLMSDEDKIPKLIKWWNPVKRLFGDKKTILFTGMPNFGRESRRWCSKKYLEKLALILIDLGYGVIQSGGEQDEHWFDGFYVDDNSERVNSFNFQRINERSFFEQIQIANEADLIVGSDSGMSLICGAYQKQMVSIIPIHWGNENNPTALSTNNPNNYSFYSIGGTDNINMDLVVDKIREKLHVQA
jgi:ADP-heptose:LPS heptosyltransferase